MFNSCGMTKKALIAEFENINSLNEDDKNRLITIIDYNNMLIEKFIENETPKIISKHMNDAMNNAARTRFR